MDWLDEASPGAFRQAQISFSSRIPHALPLADATTMSARLAMYCNYGRPDLKTVMKESESKLFDDSEKPDNPQYSANVMGKSSPGQSDNTLTPNALMLSRHEDGSLNVWQVKRTPLIFNSGLLIISFIFLFQTIFPAWNN